MDVAGVGGDRALVELDAGGADVAHPAEPHDVPDAAQGRPLGLAEDRAPVEGRLDVGVEPVQHPAVLQAQAQVVQVGRRSAGLVLRGHPLAKPRRAATAGWTARSAVHASRGRIHRMVSGSTPLSISQQQVSIDVLPAPITVNPDGDSSTVDRGRSAATSLGVGSTANGGVCVDGSDDSM